MTNFASLFEKYIKDQGASVSSGMVLFSDKSILRMYYGISAQGYCRIAFLSKVTPPEFLSTRAIKVTTTKESEEAYWTFFDLVDGSARAVYFTFCDDLTSAIGNSSAKDETGALVELKNRYMAWRTMFRQEHANLSEEQMIGLLGEMVFLSEYMIPRYGASESVSAWSGVDGLSKDFSIGEKWYEVKTASVNCNTVKINSLAQLSSATPGALVLIRYEQMSDGFDGPNCSVIKVFKTIMAKIADDEVRAQFLTKLIAFGLDVTNTTSTHRYRISDMVMYRVGDGFPRICEKDIAFKEIDKVTYSLIINSLDQFKFDGEL